MIPVLKVRDKITKKWVEILAIKGEKGDTPYIKDGYWWVNSKNTSVKAQGEPGQPGTPGSDASVTAENIKTALGYTPADKEDVDQLSEAIGDIDTALDGIIALQNSYIGGGDAV